MVFAPRKLVYPFFLIIFAVIFFSIIYLAFFAQVLVVEDSSASVVGSNVVIKMTLLNSSMHSVGGIKVGINNNIEERFFYLKGTSAENSVLDANERYEFVASIPLSENVKYSVQIIAPFNRPIPLGFELAESTINPVRAEIRLPSTLKVNEKQEYSVQLCNISGTALSDVIWFERADIGLFKEEFFERSISLASTECKTIPSAITPLKTGQIEIVFVMRVGSIERKLSKILTVD